MKDTLHRIWSMVVKEFLQLSRDKVLVAFVLAAPLLELVLMGRTPHLGLLQGEGQADLEAARRAMRATETWELADRPIGELSGGERQRVLVARPWPRRRRSCYWTSPPLTLTSATRRRPCA